MKVVMYQYIASVLSPIRGVTDINFETFLIRQQLEEEEEKMQDYMEEMKSSRPAQYADQYDSD